MKSPKQQNKNLFASKVGAILAAAGSAVGLGNVWRFPTETGENGGAAFILIYVLFMLLLATPIMVTEFVIGRHGQSSVGESFVKMSGGNKAWRWMGLLPVVSGILVLSYYAVIAGWTMHYTSEALMNHFYGKTAADYSAEFEAFSSDPVRPVIWTAVIILLTGGVVALGVQKGIERGAKVMMPLLFLFIIILVGCSLSLPDASKGLIFLFRPDFSKVTSSVVLSAMGQAFFSLSVGIGCLCTYACYFQKNVDLMHDGMKVAVIDTSVALLSGLIIFPAVYSIPGLQPDAGPSLVFVTLPNVFQQVFSDSPVIAYSMSLVFYLLLVMAALTSSISMLEMSSVYFSTKFKIPRVVSTFAVSIVCVVLGSFCSLSFGDWKDVTFFGMGFFDLFDFIVAKLLMPIGGFIMCVFVGWIVDKEVLKNEMTNGGAIKSPLYVVYRFIIRYFAPLCIFLIFANELGWFKWLM